MFDSCPFQKKIKMLLVEKATFLLMFQAASFFSNKMYLRNGEEKKKKKLKNVSPIYFFTIICEISYRCCNQFGTQHISYQLFTFMNVVLIFRPQNHWLQHTEL